MEQTQPLVIAVDGPAGVGKSTIAQALASRYALTYVETGALYRAVALLGHRLGLAPDDGPRLAQAASKVSFRFSIDGPKNHVFLDDEEVTAQLRAQHMGALASTCSAQPEVRAALLDLQRSFAAGGAVAEGRDIGTVVFPEADYKFFLVADPRERARRRQAQLEEVGQKVDIEVLYTEIQTRDKQDSGRAIAPLKAAEDAITVDTTHLTITGVLEKLYAIIDNLERPQPESPGVSQ
jgi:CMP/dCMP kinase